MATTARPGDLNLALRLQADMGDAAQKLGQVEDALQDLALSAEAAGKQGQRIEDVGRSVDGVAGSAGKIDALAGSLQKVGRAEADAAQQARAVAPAQDALAQSTQRLLSVEERRAAALARSAGTAAEQTAQAERLARSQARQEEATRRATAATTAQGVSAKQTANALRQLPAQFTDITTSLAGGQSPLLVLLQQGGQIKDSFGGAAPAIRTITGLITPLRLAVGGTAAAVGLLATAFVQIQNETSAFNLAVQATGNAAGATRGNIEALAIAANEASGISKASAREIAVSLVQSGRLGVETIGNITKTVRTYGQVTGQTTQQAASALAQAFERPSAGAAKLNEQFRFLSLEQLRYIQQLEEQGRVEAAQLELSTRLADKLSGLARDNLGFLERAWDAAAGAAKRYWDAALDIGRPQTAEQELSGAQAQVTELRVRAERERERRQGQATTGTFSATERRLQAAEARLAGLQEKQQADALRASQQRAAAATEQRRIALDAQIKPLIEAVKTNRERFEAEKKKLDESLQLGVIDQATYTQTLERTRQRFRDPPARTRSTRADPVENAFLAKQQELSLALASAQNKLQNARDGVAESDDRASVALEAWLAVNVKAQKLTIEQADELRNLAQQTDEAARANREYIETEQRKERIAAGLADVDAELASATGNAVDAAVARAEERFRKLRLDLFEAGDVSGLIRINQVVGLEKARAELQGLQTQADQIFGRNSLDAQRLQLEVQTGLVNEIDARQRLLEINKRTAAGVEALIPRMRELAAQTANQGIAAGVDQLQLRIDELKATTGTLGQQLTSAFTTQIAGALEGLATSTASLGDAVRGVLRGITAELAKVAAERLAIEATSAVTSLFSRGAQNTADAGGTAAAAATATAATALTSAGATITAGAAALTTSSATVGVAGGAVSAGAAALASAGAGLIAGAAAISASAAQLAVANATSAAATLGFADGGYTGPGGKYQPAGVVHAGEFVNRREVVRQPGALSFLSEFNRVGMQALANWRGFAGYADGGLVMPQLSTPAPLPAYQPVTPAPAPAGGAIGLRINNVVDPELFANWAQSSAGELVFNNWVRRNSGSIRQILR